MGREIEEVESEGRHPIRFLLKVAMLGSLVYMAVRFISEKKDEDANLTESQARAKLIENLSPNLGDETAHEIADQVVPKLKDRGLVKPDPMAEAAEDLKAAADRVDEAADKVTDAVDSLVDED